MDENLSVMLGLRITPDDDARIDAVVAQLPLARRMDVARAALRLGLLQLEQNPALATEVIQPKSRR